MTDSNENITRKFDLNRKKMQLKNDFDSYLTCYNLDPKSNEKLDDVADLILFFLFISERERNLIFMLFLVFWLISGSFLKFKWPFFDWIGEWRVQWIIRGFLFGNFTIETPNFEFEFYLQMPVFCVWHAPSVPQILQFKPNEQIQANCLWGFRKFSIVFKDKSRAGFSFFWALG
jgi:hypothetical protein